MLVEKKLKENRVRESALRFDSLLVEMLDLELNEKVPTHLSFPAC